MVAAVRVAVKAEQRHVGVAYVNPTTRELGACEFVDDEQFCALKAGHLPARRQGVRRAGGGVAAARGARLAAWSRGAARWPPSASPRTSTRATWRTTSHMRLLASTTRATRRARRTSAPRRRRARRASRGTARSSRRTAPRRPRRCVSRSCWRTRRTTRCRLSMHDTGRYVRWTRRARAPNVLPERTSASASAAAPAERAAAAGFSLYGLLNKCRADGPAAPHAVAPSSRWWTRRTSRRGTTPEAFVNDPEVRDTLRGKHLRALPDIERVAASWSAGARR